MSFTIEDWGSDDTIDSRDIIQRLEELTDEQADLASDISECQDNLATVLDEDELADAAEELARAEYRLEEWEKNNLEELNALKEICKQGEGYGDWEHGDVLILESYFTKYIEELIGECYPEVDKMGSGDWPYRHVKVDYDEAADEAKHDYVEIECNGHTYYFRA
jgi:hypothetical protein